MAQEASQAPLAGWLWKLGAKGLVKTSKWRYFVYDTFTGHMNYYKSEDTTSPPQGFIDIGACRSIETTDPALLQFKLNLPTRTWVMTSNSMEETIYWMEELLSRKKQLTGVHLEDQSKEEMDDGGEEGTAPPPISREGKPDRASTLPDGGGVSGVAPLVDDWLPSVAVKQGLRNTVAEAIDGAQEDVDQSRSTFFGGLADKVASVAKSKAKHERDEHAEELERLSKELEKTTLKNDAAILAKNELLAILEKERDATDKEIALKDKWAMMLQKQLRDAQETRQEEQQSGITFEELRDRLQKSQMELAHTRAMLDLQNHRLGGSMEMIAYFKSVVEGSHRDTGKEKDMLMEQLQAADQACEQSEMRNQSLEAQLYERLQMKAREQSAQGNSSRSSARQLPNQSER